MRGRRYSGFGAAFACSVGMVSVGAVLSPIEVKAQTSPSVVLISLPAQSLERSLKEVARRTGINILFAPQLVSNYRAPALSGRFTAHAAVTRLIAGRNLIVVSDGHGGLVLRLARSVETAQKMAAERPIETVVGASMSQPAPVGDDGSDQSPEIVVVGSNIRGIENRTAPVKTLDRNYIEATGYGTTTRLIESLPQNFALANQSAAGGIPGITSDRTQGAAINLRGVGEGTTLVLLNGRRMALGFDGSAVDVSTLPLSAIERVEILTDGASALYGSDAVGGVVNFVLRRDFEGAETRLRAGLAPGGVNEYRASQTFGTAWTGGSALVAGEYYKRDLLLAADRGFIPPINQIGSLLPRDENFSLMTTVNQELGSAVTVFADALYTHRDTYNKGGRFTAILGEYSDSSVEQLTANAGLTWRIAPAWQVELVGGYGRNDRQSVRGIQVGLPPGDSEALYETWSTDFKADGPLFELPGGPVRAALGGSWRSESFRYENRFGQFITNQANEDQRVYSLFGEINVPIVGAANEMQGVRRLELSLAGRYDHYSNFGSSIDPRIGLAWEPLAGLRLRGSYGTSYVAPKLTDYNTSDTAAAALYDLDPSSPFGLSYQIQILGGADTASLRPQKSESFTLGFELTPLAAPGLRLSLGYYDIDYKDQITDVPQFASLILGNPEIYGSLFTRNPTLAQVQQAIDVANAGLGFFALGPDYLPDPNFDPSTVEVIIDGRRRNLARIRTRGLDFSVGYERDIGASHINVGVEGVYILERRQQVTATSAPIETINTVFNPPELRLRARAGWSSGGWSLNAFANHVGGYTDNRVMPFAQVGSWTTIDANLSYSFGNRQGPLSGVKIALSATNLFDSDPPGVRIINPGGFDMGFDPTNASPLGRLMAIEITKTW